MKVAGKKVFITGGAGFIGTSLARRLVEHCEVVVFDNFKRDSLQNSGLLEHPHLRVVPGDVLDVDAVTKAMRGCQVVVHAAGIAGVDTVISKPVHTMSVNMKGTGNVLEAARESGTCERLINFSTSEVFGEYTFRASEQAWTSTGAVGEARWTYAVSKLAGEHLSYAYHHQYQLPTVTVRPFNVYGPGQVGEGAIHVFVTRAIAGKDLEVHNDGTQIRAWTYIDDMLDGLLACIENDAAVGQAFNIGNPQGAITIFRLALLVKELVGAPVKVTHVARDMCDVHLRVPNVDKARDLLGFVPQVSLEEGLHKTIAWYRKLGAQC